MNLRTGAVSRSPRYGFNPKRIPTAFKAEHHILPTEYKAAQNSLKLYEPLSFETKLFSVTPEIVTLPGFSLTVYRSDEDYPPNFWNKYNARKLSLRLSGGTPCLDFGVSIWNAAENRLDYFIGIATEEAKGDLSGTQELTIPGGLYAVFQTPVTTHADFVNTIHRTWEYINEVWFRQSSYERKCGPEFECYQEQSRAFTERIYIPVARKAKQKTGERKAEEREKKETGRGDDQPWQTAIISGRSGTPLPPPGSERPEAGTLCATACWTHRCWRPVVMWKA